jgi:hypothetical protein
MHKPAVAVVVVVVVVVVAADTEAVAALAEATWAALAELTSVASAELTWGALAEVTWRACAEITLAEDVVSLAATTALVARITRHTTGSTPAPTERCLSSKTRSHPARRSTGVLWAKWAGRMWCFTA